MKELCRGELFIQRMKDIRGTMKHYGVEVHGFVSEEDEKGVIRSLGFYTDKDGNPIPSDDKNFDVFTKDQFFDKDGNEISEPRIVLPCNVIYGPNT